MDENEMIAAMQAAMLPEGFSFKASRGSVEGMVDDKHTIILSQISGMENRFEVHQETWKSYAVIGCYATFAEALNSVVPLKAAEKEVL